ncbi:hypothetical protein [Streptomyces mirabilis]
MTGAEAVVGGAGACAVLGGAGACAVLGGAGPWRYVEPVAAGSGVAL